MAKILIVIALACALVAFVQSAPQFDQEYQQQPERQSKFAVLDGHFHQDPSLEYNFEWVLKIQSISESYWKKRIFVG